MSNKRKTNKSFDTGSKKTKALKKVGNGKGAAQEEGKRSKRNSFEPMAT